MKAVATLMAAMALCCPGVPVAAGTGPAIAYDDALQCAALDTIIAGLLKSSDPPTEENRAEGERYSELARRWLHLVVTLSPRGEDEAFGDYGRSVNALTKKLAAVRSAEEVDAIIQPRLDRCRRLQQALTD